MGYLAGQCGTQGRSSEEGLNLRDWRRAWTGVKCGDWGHVRQVGVSVRVLPVMRCHCQDVAFGGTWGSRELLLFFLQVHVGLKWSRKESD